MNGILALNQGDAIGSSAATMTFNGGKLSTIHQNALVIPSDRYGTLVIADNSSSIDLNPDDVTIVRDEATNIPIATNLTRSVLTFARGSRAGNGALTINGWQGDVASGGTMTSLKSLPLRTRPS